VVPRPHLSGADAVIPRRFFARRHALAPGPVAPWPEVATASVPDVLSRLGSHLEGLSETEATARLESLGKNTVSSPPASSAVALGRTLGNPLSLLLAGVTVAAWLTGDRRSATLMGLLLALGAGLRWARERQATRAVERLRQLLTVHATVFRDGSEREVAIALLVSGDVIHLSAGDMVPADVRVLDAKDLFVVQGALTGESFPVEKHAQHTGSPEVAPAELANVALLGSSVSSGTGRALVVATGPATQLGSIARALGHERVTPFDRALAGFVRLELARVAVLVPTVVLAQGLARGHWSEALLFGLAVAVGLTPEMLPLVVTLCLSRGAVAMASERVVVKRLQAIEELGAMDVLCTDKTGTLTRDEIFLARHCDARLRDDARVLWLARLTSRLQTGLRSALDRAILAHPRSNEPECEKLDEVPFDFERRMASVVVRWGEGALLVTKGAPEEVVSRCARIRHGTEAEPLAATELADQSRELARLEGDGYRVLAVASRELPHSPGLTYGHDHEHELTLEGYVAFFDPPRETARDAIARLGELGVEVKVITGDGELVARRVCERVGLNPGEALLGVDIERMPADELARRAHRTTLFARVSPAHKQRIVEALASQGRRVGFLGDGINDAPALHAAAVGISVDSATDVAREAADVVLLDRSLLAVTDGVLLGRRVFASVVKYLRMGASSSFGNSLSLVAACVLVPYLPMAPLQILVVNLLYDASQAAIPGDSVDARELERPSEWKLAGLARSVLTLGLCSSVFDCLTFVALLRLFGCNDSTPLAQARFQAGWFAESLLTQTLVVHVLRTARVPFVESRASTGLTAATGVMALAAIVLPFTELGAALGLGRLSPSYAGFLFAVLVAYGVTAELTKRALVRRGAW
jgi:Mg2+-importing ATPase